MSFETLLLNSSSTESETLPASITPVCSDLHSSMHAEISKTKPEIYILLKVPFNVHCHTCK